jgi:hypothetical protein
MNKADGTIKREQAEAQRLMDEYLAKGGKITYHEPFATTPKEPAPSIIDTKERK